MAKKYEFGPDKPHSGFLSKLFLTTKQRKSLLKWVLYYCMLLVLSVLQDVILCDIRLFQRAKLLAILFSAFLQHANVGPVEL